MTMEILSDRNALSFAILHTLAYADVFDYPLGAVEVHRYLVGFRATMAEVERILQTDNRISSGSGLYTLAGRENLTGIRKRREAASADLWPHAIRYGRILAGLPFVRMVAVTGALARNNIEQGDDIDYLVVTLPGRLWLCRASILLVSRLAAMQGIILCPNYMLSLRNLKFYERNLYTAHEVVQMIPLSGREVYRRIREENAWTRMYLPNADGIPPGSSITDKHIMRYSRTQPALEFFLTTLPFTILENWEMKRKIHKLRREQADSPESHFSADCCKGHAHRHQSRLYLALEERLRWLESGFSW